MKIGYQLKQVRERLAKGLVDKGILRTEKRNFLLFDMATHPISDSTCKEEIRKRVISILTARSPVLPVNVFLPEETPFRVIRNVALVCAAYAANVLENAFSGLGHDAREGAFQKVDILLGEYSSFPFRTSGEGIGIMVHDELEANRDKELQLEIVAAVLQGMILTSSD
jgi:golgi phosphoprotein 3